MKTFILVVIMSGHPPGITDALLHERFRDHESAIAAVNAHNVATIMGVFE